MRSTLLALVMISCSVAAQDPPPIGVQGHTMVYHTANHARSVQLMAEAGIGLVRDECLWNMVERESGVMALPDGWSERLDQSIEAGVETLQILDYFNDHYDDNLAPHTPEGREAFARYARFMVEQTVGRIRFFEIWNEPNAAGFWPPEPNPRDYAELVAVTAPLIREVNSEAYIIGGVTSMIDWEFLTAMIEAGVCEHLDAISVHPYITPDGPEQRQIFEEMERLRDLTAQHTPDGEPLDIWVTEFGYPTGGTNSVDQDTQANMLVRTHLLGLERPWLKCTVYYWFGPDGPDRSHNEDNFGLVRHDWSFKPSFHAVQTVTELVGSAEFVRRHEAGKGAHVVEFRRGDGGHLLALWAEEGVHPITVSAEDDVLLVGRYGDEHWMSPLGGRVQLDLTPGPVYLLSPVPLSVQADAATSSITSLLAPRWQRAPVAVPRTDYLEALADPERMLDEALQGVGISAYWRIGTELEPVADDRDIHWAKTWLTSQLLNGAEHPFALVRTPLRLVEPVAVRLRPVCAVEGSRVRLIVENQTDGPLRLEAATFHSVDDLTAEGETVSFVLSAEETQFVDLPIPLEMAPDDILHVQAAVNVNGVPLDEVSQQMSFMTSPRVTGGIDVDGDLSEWSDWPAIRLNRPAQFTNAYDPWDGPEDISARVHTAWDETHFHLGVEVRDQLFADSIEGTRIYKNDGLEIYFDTDHDGDAETERYSDDDHQLGLFMQHGGAVAYHWSHHDDYANDILVVINRNPSPGQTVTGEPCDYIIEASIPLARINLQPEAGKLIGFNVGINDDDDPSREHPFGQDLQLMWTGQRDVWMLPQNMGDLFLVDPQRD